jgi:hypothetical protein
MTDEELMIAARADDDRMIASLVAERDALLAKVAALEAEARVLGYDDGLETVELDSDDADGWAVFTGCEGDSPNFCAFFADKEDAEAFIALPDPEEPECKRLCDPDIVVAVLTEQGVIAANDFTINTHEQLRARIAEARSKPCKP